MPGEITFASEFSATESSPRVRRQIGRVARAVAKWIEAAARRRAAKVMRRETARRLQMLDERMLADIGLRRSDVETAFDRWSHLS
jgi:uncharacterized protein YjiS (DUF1127 family)